MHDQWIGKPIRPQIGWLPRTNTRARKTQMASVIIRWQWLEFQSYDKPDLCHFGGSMRIHRPSHRRLFQIFFCYPWSTVYRGGCIPQTKLPSEDPEFGINSLSCIVVESSDGAIERSSRFKVKWKHRWEEQVPVIWKESISVGRFFFIIRNVRRRWLSFSDRSVYFFMSEDTRNSLPGWYANDVETKTSLQTALLVACC